MLPVSRRARLRRSLTRVAAIATSALVAAGLVIVAPVSASVPPEWRGEAEAFSYKSTGAQFSDANASGGQAWNIWTNGYIQTSFTATTSGAKQVDVVARGNVAGGIWPTMRLYVDGTLVSEQTVASSTYRTYSTTVSSVASGSRTLKIEFTNDDTVNGEDRNLKVDSASIIPATGVEEWRQEGESFPTVSGSGQVANDSNASGGKYRDMWSNGYIETTMTVPASGTKQIVVYARGSVAGGVWPNMRVIVDGTTLADHSVNTTSYKSYPTTTTLSKGSHTLRIQFTNDETVNGEDRNLKVDVASLLPIAHEWKQEAEAFTTKTAGAATASTLASAGTFWNLWSNGYLETSMAAAISGRKQLRIIARGTPAAGVWPNLRVHVGTTVVANVSVSSDKFSQYVVPATMNVGANTLRLQFTNDDTVNGEDRNLHLDVVTLVGDNAFPYVQGVPRPASNSYVGARPLLSATYADPDGDSGYVDFEVYNNGTSALAASGRSPLTAAGEIATWSPSTALTNGTQYRWRARAYDGTLYAGTWTANQYFTVDATAPVTPSVSSTTFPSGSWSGTDTTSGTFTFGDGGSTDVVAYKYGLDTNPPTRVTSATSVTLVPGEGSHTFYLQSIDRAGNTSAVRSYTFGVGNGAVTSPRDGAVTAKRFTLRTAANPAISGVTYQWRRAATDTWTTIPSAHVTAAGVPVTWPVVLTSGGHPDLAWDATATAAGDGPVEVRASYANGSTTRGTRVTIDQLNGGGATLPLGSGSVNLLTGNLEVTTTDVSVPGAASDLTLTRTYNSRDPQAGATGPFGPGWSTGLSVASASSTFVSLTASGSLRTVTLVDGDTIGFTATSANAFAPEEGIEGVSLTRTAGGGTTDHADDVYELSDLEGNSTVFTWHSTAFVPTRVTQPGSRISTAYTYETVGGVTRITRALAPVPAGVTCTSPDTTRGCRSLTFDYAPAGTPVPGPSGGDYAGRLRSVSLVAWDPATASMRSVEIARWSYDANGRLYQAWDPRLPSLRTAYAYDSAGRLGTLTPPAEEPITFAYTTVPGDSNGGRLKSVSRSALAAGTATTTVVYNVPVSGTGAPADLSAAQLARWGQTGVPTDATAVFPATQVPDGDHATGLMPTSYERATITYLDVSGRAVNVRNPGGHLSVTEYDDHGNVVRDLSAANRAAALDTSTGDTSAQEAVLALRLSMLRTYSADGARLDEELGPEHDVALASAVTDSLGRAWSAGSVVRGRSRTTFGYDEGAPPGTVYHLVTTERTGVRIADTTTDADVRTTTYTYDWSLRAATTKSVDPSGLNLTYRAAYDPDTGQLTKETNPGGTAAQDTAQTTSYAYYTAGAHPTHAECGNRPEWADFACRSEPAAQPTVTAERPALPSTTVQYDMFGDVTTVTQKSGSTTVRTATIQYDAAHRPWRRSVTGTGQALPTVETYYDPTTGKPTETRTLDGTGAVTARVTRVFDTLGRVTSYTDADGNTSTSTYDVLSRPVTVNDGKGTQTRYYDEGTERRGLVTRLVDSAAGTFTATYDADGSLTSETLPNGLVRTVTRNEPGDAVRLTYAKSGSTWLAFTATPSVHGQWLAASASGLSSQEFTYDAAGRLVTVEDDVAGAGCTTRTYTFDADSNRTATATRPPGSEGECDGSATATTATATFDTASRLVASGYVYDALGRTTSVPATDAGGAALTATYHVNDLVHTLSPQHGVTRTFTADPTQRRFRAVTEGSVTRVNHYVNDGDSPAWTDEGGGRWTRNINGIGGGLAAIQDSASGVALQLTDLRSNVVATASADATATAPSTTQDTTELGSPRDGKSPRYGWLGGAVRATDSSGFMIMGARVYNPSTGRFLQVDPIKGGSANSYEYGFGDPVNNADPSGLYTVKSSCSRDSLVCESYDRKRSRAATRGGSLAHMVYFEFNADQIAELQYWASVGKLVKDGLDWSENACTQPGATIDAMFVGAFTNACKRHDFGYRNHGKIFAGTADRNPRWTVDNNFYGDMLSACRNRWAWWDARRGSCYFAAATMHRAVRDWGWKFW